MKYILDARTVSPHFPGIGRYVSNLGAELPGHLETGERLEVLRIPGTAMGFYEGWPEAVRLVDADFSPFSLRQQWQLPRLIKSGSVYHSPYYLMPYRPGIPTVLTLYDLIPILFPETTRIHVRLLFRWMTKLAMRSADQIICISSSTRRDVLAHFQGLDPEKVFNVPLAPAAHFKPQPRTEIHRIQTEYGLPRSFGLYIGINKPHKNLTRLVRAWSQVSTDVPLVIGGAWDPRYPEARITADRLDLVGTGRVRFIGHVTERDLPGLYSACRFFVFPSLYEGFGLPVLEAMACGAQVICAETSGLTEIAGETASYFDPQDTSSIAEAIKKAVSGELSDKNVLDTASQYTWERTAAATLEIYRSIAYNTGHRK